MKNRFSSIREKCKQNAVLYVCHSASPSVMEQFRLLKENISENADVIILYHQNKVFTPKNIRKENRHIFSYKSLSHLGYKLFKENRLIPGSAHFPLIDFALKHPDYSYYWFVEYDVRYSGCWSSFFEYWKNNSSDLLTCHIRNYEEEPDWCWWEMQHPEQEIPLNNRVRSFNTIYRISNSALLHINKMHSDGWSGHHEVLIPTLLLQGGFTIEDIGGSGKYVSNENRDLFYIDTPPSKKGSLKDMNGSLGNATMRWRPAWDNYGQQKNKLYHPIKDSSEPAEEPRIRKVLSTIWQ